MGVVAGRAQMCSAVVCATRFELVVGAAAYVGLLSASLRDLCCRRVGRTTADHFADTLVNFCMCESVTLETSFFGWV